MERKERAKVEPRSWQETNTRKETQQKQEKTEGRKTQRGKKEKKRKKRNRTKAQPNQQHRRNRKQASEKQSFDTVAEGSDAESKVGQRLSGVPPWETQRECTNELIGSNLVEHEKLGRHP